MTHLERAIKKPPSRAVDLLSISANALFVKVMHAKAVPDNENQRFDSRTFYPFDPPQPQAEPTGRVVFVTIGNQYLSVNTWLSEFPCD
jgi:hypothetical protein